MKNTLLLVAILLLAYNSFALYRLRTSMDLHGATMKNESLYQFEKSYLDSLRIRAFLQHEEIRKMVATNQVPDSLMKSAVIQGKQKEAEIKILDQLRNESLKK